MFTRVIGTPNEASAQEPTPTIEAGAQEPTPTIEAGNQEPTSDTPAIEAECYTLELVVAEGEGTLEALTPQNCEGGYKDGSFVELMAHPADGYIVSYWHNLDNDVSKDIKQSLLIQENRVVSIFFTPEISAQAYCSQNYGTIWDIYGGWNDTNGDGNGNLWYKVTPVIYAGWTFYPVIRNNDTSEHTFIVKMVNDPANWNFFYNTGIYNEGSITVPGGGDCYNAIMGCLDRLWSRKFVSGCAI